VTAIVGLEHLGAVYIGGDSAAIETDTMMISVLKDEKVFIDDSDRFIMGFSGSYRVGQLLRYSMKIPDPPPGDRMHYMVNAFIDTFRHMVKSKGVLTSNTGTDQQDAEVIVGLDGLLYVIDSDFQVNRPKLGYFAIGIGGPIAMGAMYATKKSRMKPEKRITLALKAAAEHNASVRPPFHILKSY